MAGETTTKASSYRISGVYGGSASWAPLLATANPPPPNQQISGQPASEVTTRSTYYSRPTVRLFGGWLGSQGIARLERAGELEIQTSAFGGGVAIGLANQIYESFLFDVDLSFYYGGGTYHKRGSLYTIPLVDDRGGSPFINVSWRMRGGYGSPAIGGYIMPLVGVVLWDQRFPEWSYDSTSTAMYLGFGLGAFFWDRIIFVEGSWAYLTGGDSTTYYKTLGSRTETWHGNLYEVRTGIDVLGLGRFLFRSSSEVPEQGKRPLPLPPPIAVTTPPDVKIVPPPPPPVSTESPHAEILEQRIIINQMVHFDFDRAVIRPESYPILDAVVSILQGHPEIRKVQIQGHTDDQGMDDYNLRLSQQRADAVREYLIAKGIDPSRLVAVGLGRTRPLVPGTTEEARARNRRTEFVILERREP